MSTIAQPSPDTVRNAARPIEREYFVRFRVDPALWERLQIFCVKRRTTMQAVGTEAVTDYLNLHKKAEPRNAR